MPWPKSRKITIAVSAAFVAALAAVAIPAFIRGRTMSAADACTNHLRQIDAAKDTWALDHHKTTNDVPTWADIGPYLPRWLAEAGRDRPTCPAGGTYRIGSMSEYATCSIGGPLHSLPE